MQVQDRLNHAHKVVRQHMTNMYVIKIYKQYMVLLIHLEIECGYTVLQFLEDIAECFTVLGEVPIWP